MAAESSATPPPPAPEAGPAIVVGGTEDERRLVRGLLLWHRRPVELESPTLTELPRESAATDGRLLVYVAPRSDEPWSDELAAAVRARPGTSTLVLLPLDAPPTVAAAARAGAIATLHRPFTSREFAEALAGIGTPSPAARIPRPGPEQP